METFEELTYFVDKNYLSLLKWREQELIKRMSYELRTEREIIASSIGLKEGEY